jgi:hypothetical protein
MVKRRARAEKVAAVSDFGAAEGQQLERGWMRARRCRARGLEPTRKLA